MRKHRELGVALLTALIIMVMMSALLIGFIFLLMTDQRLTGMDRDHSQAFYGSEAGMEKLTADLGTLFASNGAQVNALATAPPTIAGIQYVSFDGSSGYKIDFPKDGSGNPRATSRTILSGPYQGLM